MSLDVKWWSRILLGVDTKQGSEVFSGRSASPRRTVPLARSKRLTPRVPALCSTS
jgi:hypothetical protein